MTRPLNTLVLDGETIKTRLQADRAESGSYVHVDWLRFTVQRRCAPFPQAENLFPTRTDSVWDQETRSQRLAQVLATVPDCDTTAATQARELAESVCAVLGPDFSVLNEVLKGHDFYRFRWSIQRAGAEAGWVGYMASSNNKRQQAQGNTLHVNLYGVACTFAQHGWTSSMADLIDHHQADITRADLALDFFDGFPGGLDRVVQDYKAGLCDVGGRRLKCATVGDWINGRERSFYLGSKEAGKQTNVYEKGDQLYGVEANSPWLRFELRYGNKLRVLPSDILRRPADFFAGASDWHAHTLALAAAQVNPQQVKCEVRLPAETVEAEVTRNLRWAFNVAAPTIAAAFQHLGDDFLKLVTHQKLPGRLSKFSPSEIQKAFQAATHRFSAAGEVAPLSAFAV